LGTRSIKNMNDDAFENIIDKSLNDLPEEFKKSSTMSILPSQIGPLQNSSKNHMQQEEDRFF
jgi:hypothetical protein